MTLFKRITWLILLPFPGEVYILLEVKTQATSMKLINIITQESQYRKGRDLEKIIPEGALKHLLSGPGCGFILQTKESHCLDLSRRTKD